MKQKIKTIVILILPVLLAGIALWSLFARNSYFPVVGGMIAKAERRQVDLKKKIEQQHDILNTRKPIADELQKIQDSSFAGEADMISKIRSRTEQIFNVTGARVRTIGTPRQLKSPAGLELYEMNLTADAKTEELAVIMQEFSKPPFLLWRLISMRPNNMLKPEYSAMTIVVSAVSFKDRKTTEAAQ